MAANIIHTSNYICWITCSKQYWGAFTIFTDQPVTAGIWFAALSCSADSKSASHKSEKCFQTETCMWSSDSSTRPHPPLPPKKERKEAVIGMLSTTWTSVVAHWICPDKSASVLAELLPMCFSCVCGSKTSSTNRRCGVCGVSPTLSADGNKSMRCSAHLPCQVNPHRQQACACTLALCHA